MVKKTLVIGASPNVDRVAYKVVSLLRAKGFSVVPMGIKSGSIAGIEIIPPFEVVSEIDTVSLYLAPERQDEYFDYILNLHPKRVLFNPGTENQKLAVLLSKHKITWENACTLVLLSTNQY